MNIAGTGHRHQDLWGYEGYPDSIWTLRRPKTWGSLYHELYVRTHRYIVEHKASAVISGMALGFDTILAAAALAEKIPLWAYIPCPEQDSRWSTGCREIYATLLEKAALIRTCSKSYSAAAMQLRNERMVDDCDLVLACWNGKTSGGTWNCIRYAKKKEVKIHNILKAKI